MNDNKRAIYWADKWLCVHCCNDCPSYSDGQCKISYKPIGNHNQIHDECKLPYWSSRKSIMIVTEANERDTEWEIHNAIIESTHLGSCDHRNLSFCLNLKGEWRTSFAGYELIADGNDEYPGILFIKKIIETVGVDSWEELKGQYIRFKARDGICVAIGNIINDVWFEPAVEYEKLKGDKHE